VTAAFLLPPPRRRRLGYVWAAPATVIGLLLVLPAWRRGHVACVDGVLEAHGAYLRWALRHLVPIPGGASAITFGHVVIGVDAAALACTRAHERVHVGQYERWGPLFLPAYVGSSLWAAARGGDAYRDNHFEREAYRRTSLRE
jgi:hypothetical protein